MHPPNTPSTATSQSSPTNSLQLQHMPIANEQAPTSHNENSVVPPSEPLLPCIPLPTQIESEDDEVVDVEVHQTLRNTSSVWDLANPLHALESIPNASEAATKPPLPSLAIVHPRIPWPIHVHRSGASSRYVTVRDVLVTLWRAMNIPLDGADDGGRRVDLLDGKTRFVGLRKSEMGGDIWELLVAQS
ncbi:Mitogen-Activated Protein Kinase Kinase Kinase 8 [Paramarasmius palmivorus]|uniref:Mitogen-Activated Protein Kinase Kinase Kinase 8 n=1 Tax=Paramarasmius palmivorus TaxID=297713 RepID=A0AAW0CC46_9AGAR